MDDVLSTMATGWAPALVRAVEFKPLNGVLKYDRQDVLDGPTYRLFDDMIVHAPDEQVPLGHTQWRVWRHLLISFHLFEVTDITAWVALISRFESRGIRPPDMPKTDTIRRFIGGGLGITSSGYDLDLAGL